jgi:hypothetical protein
LQSATIRNGVVASLACQAVYFSRQPLAPRSLAAELNILIALTISPIASNHVVATDNRRGTVVLFQGIRVAVGIGIGRLLSGKSEARAVDSLPHRGSVHCGRSVLPATGAEAVMGPSGVI